MKGTFHLYPSSWGYDYSWGSTWIKQHAAAGRAAHKPVVLEEYGGPNSTGNVHAAVEGPWQSTVLHDTRVAMDQFWQFGPQLTTPFSDADVFTIWYNSTEYTQLARDHAAAMLAKPV
jgi:mannan endo-1,4-beta-mannosidase